MDGDYEIILLGTGLTECVLSGLASKRIERLDNEALEKVKAEAAAGGEEAVKAAVEQHKAGPESLKVLHMDKNDYYGAESASLTPLSAVFKHFDKSGEFNEEQWGRDRDWNVDLVPKFLMARGDLVKLLIYTKVSNYLEFKTLEGSFVFKKSTNKLHKVPADAKEAMASSLMGMLEKRRFRNFLKWVHDYNFDDKATWVSGKETFDHTKCKMQQIYDNFGVDQNTQDFTGHAIMLHDNDDYKNQEGCTDSLKACKLYNESLSMYGKSPYLYPGYGLGELPQAFARLSAVYGGTYMLDRSFQGFEFDANGKVSGVTHGKGDDIHTAKATKVVCDPTYALDQCEVTGEIIRGIFLLKHPIPSIPKDYNANSGQIIFPANQVGRKNDIYVGFLSCVNNVCPGKQGQDPLPYYLVFCNTKAESAEGKALNGNEAELKPAMDILGSIEQKFIFRSKLYKPKADKPDNGIYITDSYDAATHFESTCKNITSIWKQIYGEDFDLDKMSANVENDE